LEIYFDRQALRLLAEIYRSGDVGVPWRLLQKHHGKRADPYFLENLSRADYIITRDSDGEIVDYSVNRPLVVTPKFRSYILPRGRELLEERRFNLFRWVVPTVISVAALIVSVFSLLVKC
jgi:hypothetical protein